MPRYHGASTGGLALTAIVPEPDVIPVTRRADEVPGPPQGCWTYEAYATLRDDAGVPEYWIADPAARTVEVFHLGPEGYVSAGVFQGKAILPSRLLPSFPVAVEQIFV